jgi:hypothetical protein
LITASSEFKAGELTLINPPTWATFNSKGAVGKEKEKEKRERSKE